MLTLSLDDYLWYVDEFLDAMVDIVEGLGDDLANTAPDLPGANSPYAIITHCLGVMNGWGGDMIAGREAKRDRAAEFTATGPVSRVADDVREARRLLAADLKHLDTQAAPAREPGESYASKPYGRTQGGVLLHIIRELAQHLGHMEITRDLLVSTSN